MSDVLSQSVVAEVNGQLWDMHRPIEDACKLRLFNMKMKHEDPFHVNFSSHINVLTS